MLRDVDVDRQELERRLEHDRRGDRPGEDLPDRQARVRQHVVRRREEDEEPEEEDEDDDEEEEEPAPKPGMSDLLVESMMTDDGKAMVVETIGSVVEEFKGLLGALRHRLKHGVTPEKVAPPSVGQPAARQPQTGPTRTTPLTVVKKDPPAPAPPADPVQKKESA